MEAPSPCGCSTAGQPHACGDRHWLAAMSGCRHLTIFTTTLLAALLPARVGEEGPALRRQLPHCSTNQGVVKCAAVSANCSRTSAAAVP